ncbi:hypothetical protein GCM10009678_47600 [Actinomadura kijaniata]
MRVCSEGTCTGSFRSCIPQEPFFLASRRTHDHGQTIRKDKDQSSLGRISAPGVRISFYFTWNWTGGDASQRFLRAFDPAAGNAPEYLPFEASEMTGALLL